MLEVVAALIYDSFGRFLIAQRPKNKTRALEWEFVGGKVENGETKQEALVRECREELGVTVSVKQEFIDIEYTYPDTKVHLTLFECDIIEGEIQKIEHNDLTWISPKDIPEYYFCPADKDILDKIRRNS